MDRAEYERLIEEHPEVAELLEYVGVDRLGRRAYWRFKRYTDWKPTRAQAAARLAVAEASAETYGEEGLRLGRDGRPVPVAAAHVQRRLKGRKFTEPEPLTKTLEKMERLLKKIGKRVERKRLVEAKTQG